MNLINFYTIFLFLLTLFSWSFVGNNFPFLKSNPLFDFVQANKLFGWLYILFVLIFFVFYFLLLCGIKMGKFRSPTIFKILFLTVMILFLSFPAFSYDIFNYIATSKVTYFYRENPYVVMPIEIINEPLLFFMHAANKVALYGPTWILLTLIPYVMGGNNILLTMYAMKGLVMIFYAGVCWFIWRLSSKNIYSLTIFALNPLVIMETLISSHNDVVMMFFSLGSFYLLKRKKIVWSFIFLFSSILIKFSTIFLLPIFVYCLSLEFQKKKINWPDIWYYSALAMLLIFLLSPLREEIYSWYLVWPLVFVSLVPSRRMLLYITLSLSFGLLFRFAPFLFTLNWGGKTPLIKKIVTFMPPVLGLSYYVFHKEN